MLTAETKTLTYSYDDLKTFPEEAAREAALDSAVIKGHNVYFVQFERGFGYSCLVYKDGRIMPHATDHALHHPDMYRSALRELYMKELSSKLYTEYELIAPLTDYMDYKARIEYLINLYGYQREFVSIFYTRAVVAGSAAEKEENERIEKLSAGKHYNPVGHGWYADEDFVRRHVTLFNAVTKRLREKAAKNDYDFWFNAFKYEMENHEYPINWQGNYDVLSAFGAVEYDRKNDDQNIKFYFDQLNFTPTQRQAYMAARAWIVKNSNY